MPLHKLTKPLTLQKILKIKCLFQGSFTEKMHYIQENTTKSFKKRFGTIKENKIIQKNRKIHTILSPLPLLPTKNEHTIPIEGKISKRLFERSFLVTAHITNR